MFGSAYLWFGGGVLAFFMTLSLSPASLVTDGNSLIIVIIVFPESRIYDMPSAVNRETLAMAAQDCGQDDEEELISQILCLNGHHKKLGKNFSREIKQNKDCILTNF